MGTGINGTQPGKFTVTYTDGTTSQGSVTFDDWHSGPATSGELVADQMAYRNGSSGRDTDFSNFDLYAETLALDPTRTVQSVTLPTDSNFIIAAADLIPAQGKSVDLSGSYNVVGMTADSNTSSGNLDGNNDSFSATLLGSSLGLGGSAYNLGPAGSNDAVETSGQVIKLPSGQYGNLRILATAVNGQQTGTFTVTYTDTTTRTFSLTVDDWNNGASVAGETVASKMAYRNNKNGKDTYFTNFYLYGLTMPLDSTKTVSGVTFPSNPNLDVFAADLLPTQVTQVDLSASYNIAGITADSRTGSGNLDGAGNSYSSSLLGPNLTTGGVSFFVGPVSPYTTNNAVKTQGQSISLTAGKYSSLRLLGTGVNGTQTGTFTVYYSDGTHAAISQSFDDWNAGASATNESVASTMSYRNRATGGADNRTFYLYSYSLAIDSTRTVQSVALPSNANTSIFALDLIP